MKLHIFFLFIQLNAQLDSNLNHVLINQIKLFLLLIFFVYLMVMYFNSIFFDFKNKNLYFQYIFYKYLLGNKNKIFILFARLLVFL